MIVTALTEDVQQVVYSKADLCSLEIMVKKFKKMLAQMFDGNCDLGLYTQRFHPSVSMIEDIQR